MAGRDFVLVHGSWCGGWIWQQVRPLLEQAGHRVHAPSLTGLGDRSHLLSPHVNLSTHIDDIANLMRWEQLRNVVLVGHSYGGLVISGVADRVDTGAIASIVYLDAFYLADGERTVAAQDEVHRPRLIEVDGVRCLAPPDSAAAFSLDAGQASLVNGRLTPMPAAPFAEKPVVRGGRDSIARKTFVEATRCTMPFFHPTARQLEQRPDWHVERMDCDHLMMVQSPAETAAVLLRAAG